MTCPICGTCLQAKYDDDDSHADRRYMRQFGRVLHMVDHAVRAALGVGVHELDDIDVGPCVTAEDSWIAAAKSAEQYIRNEHASWRIDMQRLLLKEPVHKLGAAANDATFWPADAGDPGAAMLLWLERNPVRAES